MLANTMVLPAALKLQLRIPDALQALIIFCLIPLLLPPSIDAARRYRRGTENVSLPSSALAVSPASALPSSLECSLSANPLFQCQDPLWVLRLAMCHPSSSFTLAPWWKRRGMSEESHGRGSGNVIIAVLNARGGASEEPAPPPLDNCALEFCSVEKVFPF